VLDHVVSSRPGGVAGSPKRVVVSLMVSGVSRPGYRQVASEIQCPRIWWVEDNQDCFRTCPAILCVVFLLVGERKNEQKQRRNRCLTGTAASSCSSQALELFCAIKI
jgi:hypothetical protein